MYDIFTPSGQSRPNEESVSTQTLGTQMCRFGQLCLHIYVGLECCPRCLYAQFEPGRTMIRRLDNFHLIKGQYSNANKLCIYHLLIHPM